jgi:hypothetical protein
MGISPLGRRSASRIHPSPSGVIVSPRRTFGFIKPTGQLKLSNPDPENFKIVDAAQIGDFLILKINYPDCTNFEGNKILVFKSVSPLDLLKQQVIDPHFMDSDRIKSPIARFTPTPEGWNMAVRFAQSETGETAKCDHLARIDRS